MLAFLWCVCLYLTLAAGGATMEIEVDDENPLPPPYGLHFVGVGYNIVDGNPQVGRYGEGIVNMVQAIL